MQPVQLVPHAYQCHFTAAHVSDRSAVLLPAGQEGLHCCHLAVRSHLLRFCLQVQMQPARAKLLYERALALFPVTVYLWQQYISYLQEQGTPASVVCTVYSRQELDADNFSDTGGCLTPQRVPTPVVPACLSGQIVHHQHQPCRVTTYLSALTCHTPVLVERPPVWCCRALRNCHWVGDLWAGAMRAMELSGADDSEIAARYNAALQVGAGSA